MTKTQQICKKIKIKQIIKLSLKLYRLYKKTNKNTKKYYVYLYN